MVPIRESHGDLLVKVVGEVWVVDNQWSSETVWVLALCVGVIPVAS